MANVHGQDPKSLQGGPPGGVSGMVLSFMVDRFEQLINQHNSGGLPRQQVRFSQGFRVALKSISSQTCCNAAFVTCIGMRQSGDSRFHHGVDGLVHVAP